MKTDFQVSHSRLMVLMPISPTLVLRVVQKVRTLISPLPCEYEYRHHCIWLINSYKFTVNQDGSWGSRQTFAFVDVGFPDGIHCDTKGYVYAGCGDGVHVWNPAGQLIGKIYLGTASANFQFAGQGRMVICAETELYYVTLGAKGAEITDYDYSQVS
jgi:hypothetical protein